jgi:hypothetical protein
LFLDTADALFTGLWKFLVLYFLATVAVLLVLIQAIGAIPLDQQKSSVVTAVWLISALVPGVGIFLWVSRPARRAQDRGAKPQR